MSCVFSNEVFLQVFRRIRFAPTDPMEGGQQRPGKIFPPPDPRQLHALIQGHDLVVSPIASRQPALQIAE